MFILSKSSTSTLPVNTETVASFRLVISRRVLPSEMVLTTTLSHGPCMAIKHLTDGQYSGGAAMLNFIPF